MNYTEQLKAELKQLVLNDGAIRALRELLTSHGEADTRENLLSPAKMDAWGKWNRFPLVGIEGGAVGIALCLKWLGVQETAMTGMITQCLEGQGAGGNLPSELLRHHYDELLTTWLHGDEAFHFAKVGEDDGDQLEGEAWRFFTGIRTVPAWLQPRVINESTHFVHGSTLDGVEKVAGMAEAFGLVAERGELVQDETRFPNQVHLVTRVEHGDAPLTCGYRYPIRNRFLRTASDKQRFDAFSGANALAVRSATVAVSLPERLFGHLDSADGIVFATPIPMMPQVYVQKVADKARRGVLGKQHGLYSTWAKPAEVCRRVFRPEDIWALNQLPTELMRADFIEDSAAGLFEKDRIVFAARFACPNPLAYQSVMWRLPEATGGV